MQIRLKSTLPESIPLPRVVDDRVLNREVLLLIFCAAFAVVMFLTLTWLETTWFSSLASERQETIKHMRNLFVPFFSAYLAARVYTAMTRRYERQLERHRHLFAHILDTSVDGIVTLDADDRISTWNRGATQIFGYSEQEIVGRHASALIPEDVNDSGELKRLRDTIEKMGVLRAYDATRLTRDGRRIHVEVSTTLLSDARGNYAGRASIIRDVTERDRIRKELAKKENLAAIGEMAAAVAHEIRNPLAGIGGAVQVIGRSFKEDDERAEVITEIQSQVRRLDEAIRDLLTFARPTAPKFRRIEAAAFTHRILRVLAEEPELKRHEIKLEMAEHVSMWSDPQLLENILLNLLLNAAQAMAKQPGLITLRAVEKDNWVLYSVQDNGPFSSTLRLSR